LFTPFDKFSPNRKQQQSPISFHVWAQRKWRSF
jgi:hypothetical protein